MSTANNLREIELDTRSNGNGGVDEGVDEGLLTPSDRPVIVPRRSPSPGPGGYLPIPNNPNSIVPNKPGARRPLDVNSYATKKTVAQGMMDIALLTANANQLRYVLESGSTGGVYYYFNIVLISLSILIQLVIGILLILMGQFNVSRDSHAQKANKLNNMVVLGVFLITVINVFISAFGIEPMDGPRNMIEESKFIHKEL